MVLFLKLDLAVLFYKTFPIIHHLVENLAKLSSSEVKSFADYWSSFSVTTLKQISHLDAKTFYPISSFAQIIGVLMTPK